MATTTSSRRNRNRFDSFNDLLVRIGRGVGGVVGALYQAGRDTIDMVLRNVLPFIAFISFIIGVILKTGVGDWIAHRLSGLADSLPGLLAIAVVCAIPVISPLLGPGAVIAQIVGTLLGVQIGRGEVSPQYALPALFAINPQVGCDFIPVGLALGEAEPETVEVGVPAVLFSRLITGPLAVVIAYFASFGLYSN
jgi:PTS system glucitol/sorbitol-specific IIB component